MAPRLPRLANGWQQFKRAHQEWYRADQITRGQYAPTNHREFWSVAIRQHWDALPARYQRVYAALTLATIPIGRNPPEEPPRVENHFSWPAGIPQPPVPLGPVTPHPLSDAELLATQNPTIQAAAARVAKAAAVVAIGPAVAPALHLTSAQILATLAPSAQFAAIRVANLETGRARQGGNHRLQLYRQRDARRRIAFPNLQLNEAGHDLVPEIKCRSDFRSIFEDEPLLFGMTPKPDYPGFDTPAGPWTCPGSTDPTSTAQWIPKRELGTGVTASAILWLKKDGDKIIDSVITKDINFALHWTNRTYWVDDDRTAPMEAAIHAAITSEHSPFIVGFRGYRIHRGMQVVRIATDFACLGDLTDLLANFYYVPPARDADTSSSVEDEVQIPAKAPSPVLHDPELLDFSVEPVETSSSELSGKEVVHPTSVSRDGLGSGQEEPSSDGGGLDNSGNEEERPTSSVENGLGDSGEEEERPTSSNGSRLDNSGNEEERPTSSVENGLGNSGDDEERPTSSNGSGLGNSGDEVEDQEDNQKNITTSLPEHFAWLIFKALVEATVHMHQANAIHLDLHAGNIFLAKDYDGVMGGYGIKPLIADFGSALPMRPDRFNNPEDFKLPGKAETLAPEQIITYPRLVEPPEGQPAIGKHTSVFHLGVLIHFIVNGGVHPNWPENAGVFNYRKGEEPAYQPVSLYKYRDLLFEGALGPERVTGDQYLDQVLLHSHNEADGSGPYYRAQLAPFLPLIKRCLPFEPTNRIELGDLLARIEIELQRFEDVEVDSSFFKDRLPKRRSSEAFGDESESEDEDDEEEEESPTARHRPTRRRARIGR